MTLILGGRYKYKYGTDPGMQEELNKIWELKAGLIKKIMVKHPEEDSNLLAFKTPDQLRKILKGK